MWSMRSKSVYKYYWFVLIGCCEGLSLLVARTVRNWLSICQHLQTSDLYDATWADACYWNGDGQLVTSRTVQEAEILSLFPVHAVGVDSELVCRGDGGDGKCCYRRFDLPSIDESIYRGSGLSGTTRLFVQAKLEARTPGWLGHLACKARTGSDSNCILVPLLGAAPLSALVSLGELEEGTSLALKQSSSSKDKEGVEIAVLRQYSAEIAELRSYTTMAHPAPSDEPSSSPCGMYHPINIEYPGLKSLYQNPGILEVNEFLTADECKRLIAKARPHLQPCLVKNAETGAVEVDPTRTSTNANIPRQEIPSIVAKVCNLLNCEASHLEMFQVLHYTDSQKFSPHTDGFDGPITACGFEGSGRLVTLFCYLNSLPESAGGETHFTSVGLKISPVAGTAVIHFPNTVDLQEDVETEHESIPVAVTMKNGSWSRGYGNMLRSDPRYHEALLPSLGDDTI